MIIISGLHIMVTTIMAAVTLMNFSPSHPAPLVRPWQCCSGRRWLGDPWDGRRTERTAHCAADPERVALARLRIVDDGA